MASMKEYKKLTHIIKDSILDKMMAVLLCKLRVAKKGEVSEWEQQILEETLLQVYGYGIDQGLIMNKNMNKNLG